METTLNNKFFDFEKAKVQTLSLDLSLIHI